MLDLLGAEVDAEEGRHGFVKAGDEPGGDGARPSDAETRGVAREAGEVLELIHGQHQLGVVDQSGGQRARGGGGVGGEGGDVGRQPGVVRAVLDERRQRALVRVRPGGQLLRLARHLFQAPLVRAQQHQVVERVAVERLQHVLDDRVARREQADGVQHRGRTRDEPAQVVEHPGDPLRPVEHLRLGGGAHDHLVTAGDQQLRDGRDRLDVPQRAQPLEPAPHEAGAQESPDEAGKLNQLVPVLPQSTHHVGQQPPPRAREPGGLRRPLPFRHPVHRVPD
ncbi:MAG TPA: hypothetical protein VHM31_17400 [Polyangia bacterium]|nr:hypothetical protein [Polyangia bacterium]